MNFFLKLCLSLRNEKQALPDLDSAIENLNPDGQRGPRLVELRADGQCHCWDNECQFGIGGISIKPLSMTWVTAIVHASVGFFIDLMNHLRSSQFLTLQIIVSIWPKKVTTLSQI